jgi:hypothetical protein
LHDHGASSIGLRLFSKCSWLAICLFTASLAVAQSVHSANAPALLLANELGPQVDPAKYLVSEKYDGVRALWDGREPRFRSGRPVNAPAWFVGKLPAERSTASFGSHAAGSKRLPAFHKIHRLRAHHLFTLLIQHFDEGS